MQNQEQMIVEWDVAIAMDDGLTLRADVFRPRGDERVPVLLSYGPYGKGLAFQEGYPTAWEIMAREHPDTVTGTSNRYQNWETADPEKWVPHGYALLRIDSRGAGRSPGYLDPHSPREIDDIVQCIAWAAQQPWSNGKVGMSGISYYASNQWRAAARRPQGLAAICVWEGYHDRYRDATRHGGMLCSFSRNWAEMQVRTVQHGRGERGARSAITGELVAGPETLAEDVLAAQRANLWPAFQRERLDGPVYQERTAKLEDIDVPLLSCGNWGGQGLHLRGNVEGFLQAGSRQKWLEMHGGTHWAVYYTDYAVELQRRFFDRFLKGADNDWDSTPAVRLQVRHIDHFVERFEYEWPLARTQWQRLYLHPDGSLQEDVPSGTARLEYEPLASGQRFVSAPFSETTEITGPSAVKLFLSSQTEDADVFIVLHLIDPAGEEVTFQGALDPHTPIAQGWLRASQRELDTQRSLPYRPYHTHANVQPLEPGVPVELDVEVLPTSVVVPAGYRIGLSVLGKDYEHAGEGASLSNMKNVMRGCGPFLHDDEGDRPAHIYGGRCSLHFDGEAAPYVLLPVIPSA
ncbi:CocE/NonD family hydrolase [Achromobacter animicus]|uniref:CocE/NonD family hydrolase n=1 Tax=Achromobacter TaxID=222 RepID=UPI00126692C3|nr:CocE/NonD family hydrolase [Achromobacter animicus]MDH0683005.1 CocE/NonD family hydrolase [Achromobacter animicus]